LQALTSCSFADNGSGGVRVTKANHNIYNTAVVTVTLSTNYNGDWATTWIDANNFDLVGASYVADRSGTVTPKFTLAVDMCETAWTGVNSGVVARTAVATDGKEGSYCMQITAPASPATTTLYAYYAISSTDYSKYDKLTFFLKNEVALAAGNWRICLCSDNAGATPVDTFEIPAIASLGRWVALAIARTGGGKCGNAIQSIALYSSTVAPTASKYVRVDCFNCATTIGLNQQSLISKSSLANGTYASEMWFALQSINGNTLLVDMDSNALATAGRGYGGTTEIAACYLRETTKTSLVAASSTVVQEIQDSGTVAGGNIVFLGGFNTATSIQDGCTIFDGLNGWGYGLQFSGKSFVTSFHLNFFRYYYGIFTTGATTMCSILAEGGNCNTALIFTLYKCYFPYLKANSCGLYSLGISISNAYLNIIDYLVSNNTVTSGLYFTSGSNFNIIKNAIIMNNYVSITTAVANNNFIYNLVTSGNKSGISPGSGNNYLNNPTIGESPKIQASTLYLDYKIFVTKYAGDTNDNRVYGDGFYAISQATIRHTASGLADQAFINLTHRTSAYKAKLKIMPVVFCITPNKAITCSVYIKKSHGTDIEASLFCQGGQILGVASDVESTAVGNDTDWVKKSITFTPTEVGGVEIYGLIWWLANAADENVVFDDAECTQAT
jgi:hypothetical protein